MGKMGRTSGLFSLDQSDENGFRGYVFGHRKFELNLEYFSFLSGANVSTDICPIFD